MSNTFRDSVAEKFHKNHPELKSHEITIDKALDICTDHKIELPKSIFENAQEIVATFFKLRNSKEYKSALLPKRPEVAKDPETFSVLMGYDFHVTEDNQLKLIEINTNAASALLVDMIYQAHGSSNISATFNKSLRDSFAEEIKIYEKNSSKKVKSIAIVDENHKEQNSYCEFLMFKELFERWGLNAVIAEPDELVFDGMALKHQNTNLEIDFIYNRLTDFYLESPKCQNLRQAYLEKKVGLSPNPHEYFLLADKHRLIELSKSDRPDLSCLIKSYSFREFSSADELWQKRKQFFFKPANAFGSRGAFRGESISRKLFNEIFDKDYLAQEYISPRIHNDLKWDLRFYAYKDNIQLTAARLYKGQTTNFKMAGTGLGIVSFS